jgi:hypothetical protein
MAKWERFSPFYLAHSGCSFDAKFFISNSIVAEAKSPTPLARRLWREGGERAGARGSRRATLPALHGYSRVDRMKDAEVESRRCTRAWFYSCDLDSANAGGGGGAGPHRCWRRSRRRGPGRSSRPLLASPGTLLAPSSRCLLRTHLVVPGTRRGGGRQGEEARGHRLTRNRWRGGRPDGLVPSDLSGSGRFDYAPFLLSSTSSFARRSPPPPPARMPSRREAMQYCLSSLLRRQNASRDASSAGGCSWRAQWWLERQNVFTYSCRTQSNYVLLHRPSVVDLLLR